MSKTTSASTTRKAREPKTAATNGSTEPKQKRTRTAPEGFIGDLRALAAKHRAKLTKIMGPEKDLEHRLSELRAQRAETEGALLEVEEMLARAGRLPGLEGVAVGPEPEQEQEQEAVAP